jgi:hypothetical protein
MDGGSGTAFLEIINYSTYTVMLSYNAYAFLSNVNLLCHSQ